MTGIKCPSKDTTVMIEEHFTDHELMAKTTTPCTPDYGSGDCQLARAELDAGRRAAWMFRNGVASECVTNEPRVTITWAERASTGVSPPVIERGSFI